MACLIGIIGCEPDQFVSMGDNGQGTTVVVSNAGVGSASDDSAQWRGGDSSAGGTKGGAGISAVAQFQASTPALNGIAGCCASGVSAGGVSAGGVSAGGVSAGGVSAGGVSAGGASGMAAGQTHQLNQQVRLRVP